MLLKSLLKYCTFYRAKYKTNNFLKNFNRRIDPINPKFKNYYKNLKKNGYAVVKNFITKKECEKILSQIDHFITKKSSFVYVDKEMSDFRIFGAEKIDKSIFNFYSNKNIISVAENYLSSKIENLMTMANKVIFKNNNLGSGGGWHRDSLDGQFKCILYLVDVNENNGPFQMINNSHKLKNIFFDSLFTKQNIFNTRIKNDIVDKLINENNGKVISFTGLAGTLLLVDTSSIHRGKPLKEGTRYALTNYFYPWYSGIFSQNTFTPKVDKYYF